MWKITKAFLPFFIVPIFILLVTSLPGAAIRPEMIRVALLKGADQVRIDGTGILIMDERREPIKAGLPLTVKGGRRLILNGQTYTGLIVSAPAVVRINGKPYRGTIEIIPQDKGLLVVDELPLEEYLVGLINCEISSSWPLEAIKAQAVVARSFARYQKEARKGMPYHLETTVLDQVYDGCAVEDQRAARGVEETEGEVVTWNGAVAQAFFHANCGGHTESSDQVWSGSFSYLSGVSCGYCLDAPTANWEQTISLAKIEIQLKGAGVAVTGLRSLVPGPRNRSGRITTVRLTTAKGVQEIPATLFRKAQGYTVIKSTSFDVSVMGDMARFTGTGYGHGVGLCQWGARSRAADGFSYREILSYYYPGTVLKRLEPGQ